MSFPISLYPNFYHICFNLNSNANRLKHTDTDFCDTLIGVSTRILASYDEMMLADKALNLAGIQR